MFIRSVKISVDNTVLCNKVRSVCYKCGVWVKFTNPDASIGRAPSELGIQIDPAGKLKTNITLNRLHLHTFILPMFAIYIIFLFVNPK